MSRDKAIPLMKFPYLEEKSKLMYINVNKLK